MKRIDIFCASPASTAVCPSHKQQSLVRQGSQSRLLERQGSRAFEPSNSLPADQKIRKERPRRSTESRPSNTDLNPNGIEPSQKGFEEKESRRSTHRRRSNYSISRFSCSAIDQLAIVPDRSFPVKKCPVVVNNDIPLPSSSSSADATEVVVLRVSLHCQGCAGKVSKHIAKMEGVTSFNIDVPKQKVTVVGNITPSGVLQSISRVKNAELWSSSKSNNYL